MIGGDDVKHQDDKESDVGEVSSPASQDHHSHHNLLTEGEEEEIEERKNVSNLPSVEGVKIEVADEHNIVVERTVIPVEGELEIEAESDKKNGRFDHDETARKSYDGGSSGSSSSSSSSSSSDDESHGIKSSPAVVDIAPVSDIAAIEEASDSVVENIPAVVSEKISFTGEKAEVDMSSPANNSAAPSIVESVFKENGEKKQSSVQDQVGLSETFKDAASQQEEAIIPSVENIAAVPDPNICLAEETDDRLSLSYNAPIATADNGADADKDSGVTEVLSRFCSAFLFTFALLYQVFSNQLYTVVSPS